MEFFKSLPTSSDNLLTNKQFRSYVSFQATYANSIKGGHLPYFLNSQQRERLVAEVNLLTSEERSVLVQSHYHSRN
ncbi:MAG: hypothetical protein QM534_17020 [Sediminibacterium sp.]|nr:hypothetical protein [Sediminibacterium sp.]